MGRSGDLLRQKKAEKVIYHMTRAQMEEHDKQVRTDYKEILINNAKAQMDAYHKEREEALHAELEKRWEEIKKEFHTGDAADDFYNLLQYMLAVPCKVLIEKFNWPSHPNSNNVRRNLNVFMEAVTDEINDISSDDTKDIRLYNDEVFKKYGIRFDRVEEE